MKTRMNMKNMRRRRWLFPLLGIAAIASFSLVVMLLWNAIIPGLTGWSVISYWKALGLFVLSKILFSGFPRRGGHGRPAWAGHMHMRNAWWMHLSEEERANWAGRRKEWRDKWHAMSDEERSKLKQDWKARCKEWH